MKNASMGRPVRGPESPAKPHECLVLPGHLAAIFVVVVLAGCASAPPAIQTVEVPVYRPCVGYVPIKPDYEFGKLSLDATAGDKILALARDWSRGRKYEGEIEAVLAGCM